MCIADPSCFHAKTIAGGSGCDATACVHSTRDVSRIQTKGDAWRTLGETAGGSVPMLRAKDGGAQVGSLKGRDFLLKSDNFPLTNDAQLYELVGFPYFGVYLGLLDV